MTQAATGDAKEGAWFDSSQQREFPLVHFLKPLDFPLTALTYWKITQNSFYCWLDTANTYPFIFFSLCQFEKKKIPGRKELVKSAVNKISYDVL